MSGLFRSAGDIIFDDYQPMPGQVSNVQLKKFSETSNFLQFLKPLTPQHPYFFAQIRALAQNSKITLGIAGPDIDEDAHPGHWNHTVGYHMNTGQCFSSHMDSANTKGEKFSIGDMFGVLITHFGEDMSTVMFLRNGTPVATRYLFESDQSKFLPTLCLENGPVDLGVMWPEAALGVPRFDENNMLNWIKDSGVQYDPGTNIFHYDKKLPEVTLQCPVPLNKELVHYEVIVQEAVEGESPAVGIATCSPLWPVPTCVLLRDFFRWKAEGTDLKSEVGQRIGFGIHYGPEERSKPDFDDKKLQLVLCFVTVDMQIVFFRMMLQPPGGFFPLVILSRGASKVELDLATNRDLGNQETTELLDNIYTERATAALQVIEEDKQRRLLDLSKFRKSDDIVMEMNEQCCRLHLPAEKKRIHAIQLRVPLSEEACVFYCEVIKMNDDSVIGIGIGDAQFNLSKHPGKHKNSTGYISKDGKLYYNERDHTDKSVIRFSEGDTIAMELIHISNRNCNSVVRFIRNGCPVGTQFVTISNKEELFPVVSLCGNGYSVHLNVFWQNQVSQAQGLKVANLHHWCLPEGAEVDNDSKIVTVKPLRNSVCVQCPTPLNEYFSHFEVKIIDEYGFDNHPPPPMIALSSASSMDVTSPTDRSHFRLDHLRFWAVGEAAGSVKVGDLVGWGMLIPESQVNELERLVICFLTINRSIVLTRVVFEPEGGWFPIVLLAAGVKRVQFEFSAIRITEHPLTDAYMESLITETKEVHAKELELIAAGKDIDELNIKKTDLMKYLPEEIVEKDRLKNLERPANAKMSDVVMKAKGLDNFQKAVKGFRDIKDKGQGSKACVIL
ncbi:uncharacterized protein LOC127851769 [Dreissena polymorpha]|uniref:B30.2/SPRY domain-containing protein n=1 Tax=Dreissena polymorpha TaxID=45954 RepID=A0A9D4I1M0_DREPO|nr:uncharacterized protein LOC127851769 [Dreissena polymorpha]XP_052241602.1 uncharacterized protein LOC127851769 [Dreissena polymorpha]KAH3739061.1 hypothetical protein DPMN_045707 [Dreissena polymorpha]